jgi:hemerythrin-like domain-containing protein
MKKQALDLIRDEHRSLSAVIHGARWLADDAVRRRRDPDFKLMHAMLYYIREFPEKRHHPSEDRELFARVRNRTREADAVLDALDAEHKQGEAMLDALVQALSKWEAGIADGAAGFDDALHRFADFYWGHMSREENDLLPIAQRVLTDEDWKSIHAAFAAHGDPTLGKATGDEFRELFSRIVRIAPPPIGLGDPQG